MRHKEYSKKERLDALRKFPEAMQEAVMSVDLAHQFQVLIKKHDLRLDEAGALGDEINLALVGLERPNELLENIKDRVHKPGLDYAVLIQDINEMIFKPIRAFFTNPQATAPAPQQPAPIPSVITPQKPATPQTQPIAPAQTAPTTPVAPVAPVITPAAPTSPTVPAQGSGVRTLNTDFAKERMERQFRMPPTTSVVKEQRPVNATSGEKPSLQQKYSGGVDPYREPTK